MTSTPLSTFIQRCKYPVISGFFAFLAGFVGKHAFSDDFGGLKQSDHFGIMITSLEKNLYATYAVRGMLFLLMLYFNTLMIKFFIHSLQKSGATITTILNFSFNFVLSGISSFIYFNEPFKVTWLLGLSLILCGILLLSNSKDARETRDTPTTTTSTKTGKAKTE